MKTQTIFITSLLLVFGLIAQAQILDAQKGKLFDNEPAFNQEFLKNNNIKVIQGGISEKKSLEVIVDQGLVHQYEYDREAQLTRKVETFRKRGGVIDSTSILYHYDDIDQLISKSRDYQPGFSAYNYEYDVSGNLISHTYSRGERISYAEFVGRDEPAFELFSEKYTYQTLANGGIKKTFINNRGKAYKESVTDFDTLGNVAKETIKYVLSGKRNEVTYTYDDLGRLHMLRDYSNLSGPLEMFYIYKYDKFGNVMEELIHKNGKLMTVKQFIYEEQTFLLKVQLIKDEPTEDITIIRYRYDFFDSSLGDQRH